jgi:hypothetical protein
MKLNLASIACLLLIFCNVVFGQEIKKVQEPEYLGTFFLLDSSTGTLVPLERQTPQIKTKASGLDGWKRTIEIKGERSPVRFKEGQTLEFVVLAPSQQTDPQGSYQFFSLESKGGKRQLLITKTNSLGTSVKTVMNEKAVPFNATKYGTSSFKISPAQNLAPGEYTLGTPNTNDGFCFGIDPANQKP